MNFSFSSRHAEPKAYAILIGPSSLDIDKINRKYGRNVIYGSTDFIKPDITNLLYALSVAGFDKTKIFNLSNRAVTKSEVLSTIQSVADITESNDLVFIYFTGHGDQIDDRLRGDEPDGLDEVLVLSDDYLKDDEVNSSLKSFKKNERIILVVDACHSGTTYKFLEERTDWQKLMDARLEVKKGKSNKVFEDEFEKRQTFNEATCDIQDFSDSSNGLNFIYYGASSDDEDGKADTQGSFFTSAFTKKFRYFPAVWKTLTYRSLFCDVHSQVKTLSQRSQNCSYKEIGNTTIFENAYPLKIK